MPKKSVWETYRDQVIKKELTSLDQLSVLYEQAKQHHQQGEWLDVLDIFVRIKAVKNDYPDPDKILLSAEKEIEKQEKQAELEAMYVDAQEDIFNGRWGEAQRILKKIIKDDPNFKDTNQLLTYVESSLNAKHLATEKKKEARLAAIQTTKPAKSQTPIDSKIQNERHFFQQWLGIMVGVGLLGILTWIFFATIPYWSGYFKSTTTPSLAPTEPISIAILSTNTPNPSSINSNPASQPSQPAIPTFTSSPTLTPLSTETATQTEVPSPTINPTLGVGSIQISPIDGMSMVYVPEGKFLMGPDLRSIYLDAYWVDRTEVTNAMFAQCVAAGACTYPSGKDFGVSLYADYPVVWINWFEAEAYCQWAGRRLLTEAEWEKAARGTDGREFPWGNTALAANLLNFCDKQCTYNWKSLSIDDGYTNLAPVGSFPDGVSPYGALDMAGNVLEWVADWYQKIIPASSPTRNPLGASIGVTRALKGGSYNNNEFLARSYSRSGNDPNLTYGNVGFRCAQSP